MVWHRQNWSIVHPYVHLEDDELERLTTSITYVAGFTDASVESRTELYDLFVNGRSWELNTKMFHNSLTINFKFISSVILYLVDYISVYSKSIYEK